MKTLNQCKDETCKKIGGFHDYSEFCVLLKDTYRKPEETHFAMLDEAAELYAEYKTEELQKEVERLNDLVDTLKKGILKGDELYSNLVFAPEELSPYQKALKRIAELEEEVETLRQFDER